MNTNYKKKTGFFVLLVIVIAFVVYVLIRASVNNKSLTQNKKIEEKQDEKIDASCIEKKEKTKIQGPSLSGVIENGEEAELLVGFYQCNIPQKGDIIAFNHAGSQAPLVKIIKGIPSDMFDIKSTQQGSYFFINNEIVKNSEGKPYLIDSASIRLLSLYIRDYKNIIPPDSYIILGNIPIGSEDSTRFGLVAKSDFLGKVVK